MYAKFIGAKDISLRGYHHVCLDGEFKKDCNVWKSFLQDCDGTGIARPFIDFYSDDVSAEVKFLLSDAMANSSLGFGVIFNTSWLCQCWNKVSLIKLTPPSNF